MAEASEQTAPTRRGGVWPMTKRTLARAWYDDIFSESAAAAFWQTLSLPPLLLGLLGSLGYVGSWFAPNTLELVRDELVTVAGNVFSRDAVEQVIVPTVDSILTTGRSELIGIGLLISLWSGSSAVAAFVDAITRAHGQYGVRNPVWQRVLALLLSLAGLLTAIVGLPLLVLGPDRIARLLPESWYDDATSLISWFYYPVLGIALVLALTTLYRLALPAKPPWYRGLPGALLAAVVFLVGVTGLRIYLDLITGTGYTYGALAAPIAFLLAAFFLGLAIVLGAHLNASIQHFHPVRLADRRGTVDRTAATANADDTDTDTDTDTTDTPARETERPDTSDTPRSDTARPDTARPGPAEGPDRAVEETSSRPVRRVTAPDPTVS